MSHSCIDKHTDNVTTSTRSVHPLLAHKHEDADAIHQLRCRWCFGPRHAKHEANVASVRRCCTPVTGRLAPGRRRISCSPLDWGRDCLVAIDPVERKPVLLALSCWKNEELAQHVAHHGQQLLWQEHVTLVSAVNFCSWINEEELWFISLIGAYLLNMTIFFNKNISQGSVATRAHKSGSSPNGWRPEWRTSGIAAPRNGGPSPEWKTILEYIVAVTELPTRVFQLRTKFSKCPK